jgi:hypothetical protein
MPQDNRKLRPKKPTSISFKLIIEDISAGVSYILTEADDNLVCNQKVKAATAGVFFDFPNFKFF